MGDVTPIRQLTPAENLVEWMRDPEHLDHAAQNAFESLRLRCNEHGIPTVGTDPAKYGGQALHAEWLALTDEQRDDWRHHVQTIARRGVTEEQRR